MHIFHRPERKALPFIFYNAVIPLILYNIPAIIFLSHNYAEMGLKVFSLLY